MEEFKEEWFTLDSIDLAETDERLYCIAVDSPDKQFLIGEMGVPTHNTEEGKNEDLLKGEAAMIIGSIARLGRAAGVHLVIATQRPDATLISGETKANLGVRLACGRVLGSASSMILENGEGNRIKSNPKGRLYLKIYGDGDHGQGFFASSTWIEEWLASKGLNNDGTPISGKKSKLVNLTDFDALGEEDLDSMTGVDNASAIDRIREAEAQDVSADAADDMDNDPDDWSFLDDIVEDDAPDVTESNADATNPYESYNENEETDADDPYEGLDPSDAQRERPLLGGKKDDDDKWVRPEESWDQDMDDIINQNYN